MAKLLLLSFWFGGGVVAGGIVPLLARSEFGDLNQEQAEAVRRAIIFWFSMAEALAGGLLFALTFYLERARRWFWIAAAALGVLPLVNEHAIATWMRAAGGSTAGVLRSVYTGIFLGEIALALVLFAVTALASGATAPGGAEKPAAPPPAARPGASVPPPPPAPAHSP